mgnify:CR=1 FL=1
MFNTRKKGGLLDNGSDIDYRMACLLGIETRSSSLLSSILNSEVAYRLDGSVSEQ